MRKAPRWLESLRHGEILLGKHTITLGADLSDVSDAFPLAKQGRDSYTARSPFLCFATHDLTFTFAKRQLIAVCTIDPPWKPVKPSATYEPGDVTRFHVITHLLKVLGPSQRQHDDKGTLGLAWSPPHSSTRWLSRRGRRHLIEPAQPTACGSSRRTTRSPSSLASRSNAAPTAVPSAPSSVTSTRKSRSENRG